MKDEPGITVLDIKVRHLYMQARVVTGPPWHAKYCIYTLAEKKLYVKLTYCDHSNKNIKPSDLRITKSWVQQK